MAGAPAASPEGTGPGEAPLDAFLPAVAGWFRKAFAGPSPAQVLAWPAIRRGDNTLLLAPTGSGKTLAAFLCAIDDLFRRGQEGGLAEGVYLLYVTPLKALGNDIRKNLLLPLAGIREESEGALPELRVAVRSGDTPQHERAQMVRRPPHILITTPESLYLLLQSEGMAKALGHVRTVHQQDVGSGADCRREAGAAPGLVGDRLQRRASPDAHGRQGERGTGGCPPAPRPAAPGGGAPPAGGERPRRGRLRERVPGDRRVRAPDPARLAGEARAPLAAELPRPGAARGRRSLPRLPGGCRGDRRLPAAHARCSRTQWAAAGPGGRHDRRHVPGRGLALPLRARPAHSGPPPRRPPDGPRPARAPAAPASTGAAGGAERRGDGAAPGSPRYRDPGAALASPLGDHPGAHPRRAGAGDPRPGRPAGRPGRPGADRGWRVGRAAGAPGARGMGGRHPPAGVRARPGTPGGCRPVAPVPRCRIGDCRLPIGPDTPVPPEFGGQGGLVPAGCRRSQDPPPPEFEGTRGPTLLLPRIEAGAFAEFEAVPAETAIPEEWRVPMAQVAARRAVVERYLRRRGPVTLYEVANHTGWPAGTIEGILQGLVDDGKAACGVYAEEKPRPQWVNRANLEDEPVVAFNEWLVNEYQPPKDKRLLAILQCSVRRPFSSLPSHASMRRAIRVATGCDPLHDRERCPVHVVVLASALGPVPYEMEGVYPANVGGGGVKHFDGAHYARARPILAERMARYVATHRRSYDRIATFTEGRYAEVMAEAARRIVARCPDAPPVRILPVPGGPEVLRVGRSVPRKCWERFWIQLALEVAG